jgi:hypothetical protein
MLLPVTLKLKGLSASGGDHLKFNDVNGAILPGKNVSVVGMCEIIRNVPVPSLQNKKQTTAAAVLSKKRQTLGLVL